MKCSTHPYYKVQREPSSQCPECWAIWLDKLRGLPPTVSRIAIAKSVEAKLVSNGLRQAIYYLLVSSSIRQAVYYQHPKLVVKVTRRGKPDGRHKSCSFIVTIGVPAFKERLRVTELLKAGEPFPVKKIQLKYYKK